MSRSVLLVSAALCLAALSPGLSSAETLNLPKDPADNLRYTFIEGDWITQDADDLNIDGEGYAIHAGMRLDPHWHIFGDYSRVNLQPGGLDLETALAGFGYSFDLSNTWDLITNAGWARAKLNRVHTDGWVTQAMVRGLMGQRFELESGVQYVDFGDDGGDDTSFNAALRFNVTQWFSVGLNGSVGGDITQYGIGFRFSLE